MRVSGKQDPLFPLGQSLHAYWAKLSSRHSTHNYLWTRKTIQTVNNVQLCPWLGHEATKDWKDRPHSLTVDHIKELQIIKSLSRKNLSTVPRAAWLARKHFLLFSLGSAWSCHLYEVLWLLLLWQILDTWFYWCMVLEHPPSCCHELCLRSDPSRSWEKQKNYCERKASRKWKFSYACDDIKKILQV